MRNAHEISVEKPGSKRQLGRSREDNIKMYLKETGCEDVDPVAGCCEHGNESA
jgi:hypothetical protein